MLKVKIKHPSTRTQERQQITNFFYHHFLFRYKLSTTKNYFEKEKVNFSPWQIDIFNYAFSSFSSLVEKLQKNLDSKWNFEEISNLDKSILLVAVSEFFLEITPRAVIIAEAVKASKLYGTNHSYRFINKTLEKTLIKAEI